MPALRQVAAALAALLSVGAARAETAYVSNEQDDTISIIDGATLAVTGTIRVGRRPRGLALSPDGRSLVVAVGDDNRIDPELFVVHPDGKRLFVANENDSLVSVVDIIERKIVGEVEVGIEPEGMAASPDGSLIVCTSETTSMAHVIDAGTLELLDNVLVDTRPRAAVVAPDSRRIYVSSELRGTVTVIDAESRAILGKVGFPAPGVPRELVQAVGLALTRDGTRLFVALGPANRVAEVNAATLAVERTYLVGQRVWNLALSPDGRRLYTANGNSSDVSVIDLDRREVVKSLGVGRAPWGVVVAP
jgi:PQQ-dependent catabolism-associated beta-propeller protein